MIIKKIIFFVFLVISLIFLSYRVNEVKQLKENRKNLLEEKSNLDKKIVEIIKEKNMEKEKMHQNEEQIQFLTQKISLLSIENEAELKKMIFVFAKESDLQLKEISKSEEVWERNGYRLKYIHFTLYGSLNDFGRFLYYINKSKKYIDTTKTYIELNSQEFKISLGFIEKNNIEIFDK